MSRTGRPGRTRRRRCRGALEGRGSDSQVGCASGRETSVWWDDCPSRGLPSLPRRRRLDAKNRERREESEHRGKRRLCTPGPSRHGPSRLYRPSGSVLHRVPPKFRRVDGQLSRTGANWQRGKERARKRWRLRFRPDTAKGVTPAFACENSLGTSKGTDGQAEEGLMARL